MSNSSATISASAVEIRWPMSTFPVRMVTRPLLPIDSQPSRSGVLARLGLAATRRALLAEAAERPEHAGMGAAAAEVAAQRLAYLGLPRLGRSPQQGRAGDSSDARRVGKECVSPCCSRVSPQN